MCGISAVVGGRPGRAVERALEAMHSPIRHRGPDGEGFLRIDRAAGWTLWDPRTRTRRSGPPAEGSSAKTTDDTVAGLAFRRLKILDLTDAAAQPMGTPDGARWIVFNGEVYNFRELRRELAAQGRVFRSTGDTEVVLAAYDAWGTSCFARFEGMWALVLLDLRRKTLVASRDRFGIKPLYWAAEDGRFFLASEIKQVLAARTQPPKAHASLVAAHLRGSRLPALEETFFADVRAVPPGTWFELPFEDVPAAPPRFHRYWDLADHYCRADVPAPSYRDAVEALRARLESAVASHDVADVEIGALLSGGLDSSILAGLFGDRRAREGRRLHTYSFGFRAEAPEACEMPFVDTLARARGLANVETSFDPAWVGENAPAVVRAIEEPPLSMAALAQYRVFQLCSERGATVVIDGQAADEVFGGYPYHQRLLLLDRLRHGRLGAFATELRAIGRREGASPHRLLTHGLLLPLLARRFPRASWLDPEYGTRAPAADLREALADRSRDPSLLNRRLYADVKWGNVKIVLGYGDKNAMAHSVEARVPYLDRRLVEFAFSLPDAFKVGGGERKRVLRDCARGLSLPREITERADRMGFGVPETRFLRGGLWPTVRDSLLEESFARGGCFVPGAIARLVGGFASGRERDPRGIWRLYALAVWSRSFGVSLG